MRDPQARNREACAGLAPQEVVEKLLIPLGRDWEGFAANSTGVASRWRPRRRLRRLFWHGHACSVYAPLEIRDGKLARFDMYTDTLLIHRAMRSVPVA